ncbi:hypothetical protein LOAG_15683 [Loa loa]|uniref:Uncharacterized protein n=1 Tax=Loa loa TaxID=7209 RepID=A0A1S0TFM2_LOALO|nr:hypothetical protein LOAG_15683 [Loa loa]EFO12850.1 hypothetical protein LOAG_15683 [Loa loa]
MDDLTWLNELYLHTVPSVMLGASGKCVQFEACNLHIQYRYMHAHFRIHGCLCCVGGLWGGGGWGVYTCVTRENVWMHGWVIVEIECKFSSSCMAYMIGTIECQ